MIGNWRVIGDWIALDDPRRSVSFVRELREACLGLADRAFLYPVLEAATPEVRKRRHGRYLILFAANVDHVEILHVVHGARNYRELFTKA